MAFCIQNEQLELFLKEIRSTAKDNDDEDEDPGGSVS
jgi:hypothetical protein